MGKYRITKLIIIGFIALSITSCCRNKQISTIRFAEEDLIVNPYNGDETFTFVDDSSKQILYHNGSRGISMLEMPECDGGCCDYYMVEYTDNTYFESDHLQSNLQIVITNQFDRFNGLQDVPIISFYHVYTEGYSDPTYTNYTSLRVDNMEAIAEEQEIFKDSLMLRDEMYFDVFTLPGICSNPDRLYADTMYFTKTEGVIGLKFTDGNLWTLTD